jgi:hypothetical protein
MLSPSCQDTEEGDCFFTLRPETGSAHVASLYLASRSGSWLEFGMVSGG